MFVQWCSETNSVIKGAQAVAGQGEGWLPLIEGDDFVVNSETQTSKYVLSEDGGFVTVVVEGLADLNWEQQRVEAYGVLSEQLDKIYHDINEGKLDKTGAFYAHIKSVKDEYPKP